MVQETKELLALWELGHSGANPLIKGKQTWRRGRRGWTDLPHASHDGEAARIGY